MPSHGVEIIDGIPVILKGEQMFAFHPAILPGGTDEKIQIGTYDSKSKKAEWYSSDSMNIWVKNYQTSISPRARK
jgi:hypothetical protein